jgi:hypothetical protein
MGALGDPYVTLEELKSYVQGEGTDAVDDDELESSLASVSAEIEDVCERQFNRAEIASARSFEPAAPGLVFIDDFWTLADLVVTVDGAVWTANRYKLWPSNGLLRGRPWPYNRLEARDGYSLPTCRESVTITARWGWAEVPAPIREACKIHTADTFGLRSARFGVAGFGQYGDLRVRDNPMALAKLKRYMRNKIKVA